MVNVPDKCSRERHPPELVTESREPVYDSAYLVHDIDEKSMLCDEGCRSHNSNYPDGNLLHTTYFTTEDEDR